MGKRVGVLSGAESSWLACHIVKFGCSSSQAVLARNVAALVFGLGGEGAPIANRSIPGEQSAGRHPPRAGEEAILPKRRKFANRASASGYAKDRDHTERCERRGGKDDRPDPILIVGCDGFCTFAARDHFTFHSCAHGSLP